MNIKEILFCKMMGYNPELQEMKQANNEKLESFHKQFIAEHGYDISNEVIKTISVKRLMDCYSYNEIMNILQYFKQLR